MDEKTPRVLAMADEENKISRAIMAWVNAYPDLPEKIARVDFEQLPADRPGMAVSIIQGAYITQRYILGGHEGKYEFKIIYRIKPGNSNDARLTADEVLNTMGDWAQSNPPKIENVIIQKLEAYTRSSLFAVYENGDEDHQILLRLTYEVL